MQATDVLSNPEDYERCDNLGLEDLFAELTDEGLEQRLETQEIDSVEEGIPDVLNDDGHELFED